MKVTAIVAAGGKGTRMGADKNKVFLKILNREILSYTVSAFENNSQTDEIVIVTGKEDIEACRKLIKHYGFKKVKCIVEGGAERQSSVMHGLEASDGDIALIHDGARALVTDNEINNAIADCKKYGAAAAGVKCKDTLKNVQNGFITATVDRENTYMIQTPQAFGLPEILNLHKKAQQDGISATDDCMLAEHYGVTVKVSEGSYENIKLTTPEDMFVAERILKRREN